jgi:asparagine synthase (glutamine-hydrolysing)
MIGALLQTASPQAWELVAHWLPVGRRFTAFGDKVHKGAAVLNAHNFDEVFFGLVSNIQDPGNWVHGGIEHRSLLNGPKPEFPGLSNAQRMMALDAVTYLPDDILVKVDRAAMACSLETRAPYLDHQVFEFACQLPLNMKISSGRTKLILREILYRHVPPSLVDRPKSGFSLPLDEWLRGPLREWADSLFEPCRVGATGLLNQRIISKYWSDHLSERFNRTPELWTVLMFMSWYENYMNNRQ